MPVELPVMARSDAPPSPPGAFVWLALFVVFMAIGVAATLLTWPKGEPTNTPWFWLNLLAFPALAWGVAFGLRKNDYEQKLDLMGAENEVLTQDREEAIRFASEPLAVIAAAYQCAMGSNLGAASAILDGVIGLKSQKPYLRKDPVMHTVLDFDENKIGRGRYKALFEKLLGSLHGALSAMPPDVPFDVCLQLPVDSDHEDLSSLWTACWDASLLRPVKPVLLSVEEGVMALDRWLDISGGPELQKFTLFVAVQLHDTPPENSAEAGVALLLCWPLVAERKKMKPLAMLHRPLETAVEKLKDDIPVALLWGKAELPEIKHVWMTGLNKEDKAAFNLSASDIELGTASSEDLSGNHNVDVALGYPGAAAEWLATAFAIESAQESQEPQMIASRERTLRLAVVQPIPNEAETV